MELAYYTQPNDYIEGLKDYAKIHLNTSEKSILTLITLKALEDKLPKGRFMRIHNSFIGSHYFYKHKHT